MSITLDGTNGITTPDVTSTGLTADTTTLVVDDVNDRVGIGTSSPATRLSVDNTRSDTAGTGWFTYTNSAATNGKRGMRVDTNNGYWFDYYNGSSWSAQMGLDSSGNLLVGTTIPDANSGAGFKFWKNGESAGNDRTAIVFPGTTNSNVPFTLYSTGANAYRFYVGAGGTIYATSSTITALSDRRLKENIRDLDDGLSVVMSLTPRKFDWKEGKGRNVKNDRGWIADEIKQVVPDLVEKSIDPAPEGEAPYETVRPDLVPILVKAIQEQQAMLLEQAATITSLTARVEALEANNV